MTEAMGKHSDWVFDPYVCMGCGSHHVHIQMWVEVYTGSVDWRESPWTPYSDPKESGVSASYCPSCQEDHGIALMSEILEGFNVLATLTTGTALDVGARCPTCYWEYRYTDARDPSPECADRSSRFACAAVRERRASAWQAGSKLKVG